MDLKACRVLVTSTSFGAADPTLRAEIERACGEVRYNESGKPLAAAELAAALRDVDGCIAGVDRFDAAALAAAERLKVVARYGVGTDNVDVAAARERGIVVTNTPGANSVSVAELAIGLMLALARRIPQAAAATRSGGWPRTPGVTLSGKCIGIVGVGSIGRLVAARLSAFGCELLGYDPFLPADAALPPGVTLVSLEQLAARADFVTLHAPLLPETRSLVDDSFLRRMKHGAFLVNTARGELVDEAALARAIVEGRIGGAALDVFASEPPARDNPLLALESVIATPHAAAHSDDAMNRMGRMALDDCLAVLRGEPPKHRVA